MLAYLQIEYIFFIVQCVLLVILVHFQIQFGNINSVDEFSVNY